MPTDIFIRRLAAILLTQVGILPRKTLGLKPKKEGFQNVGEILHSEEWWDRKRKEWRKDG